MLFLNTIHCIDFSNNVGDFVLCGQVAVLVPIVEVERQDVLRLLVVWISHTEHRGPHVHSLQLIVENVAALIASDDATDLPALHLIEEVATRNAYFANDVLV